MFVTTHPVTINKVKVQRGTGVGVTRSTWSCKKCKYTSRAMKASEAEAAKFYHEGQWMKEINS